MAHNGQETTDRSSIKPVSSLLSRFEGLKNSQERSTNGSSPSQQVPTPSTPSVAKKPPPPPPVARRSLDVSRPEDASAQEASTPQNGSASGRMPPPPSPRPHVNSPRPRPFSMQVTRPLDQDFNTHNEPQSAILPSRDHISRFRQASGEDASASTGPALGRSGSVPLSSTAVRSVAKDDVKVTGNTGTSTKQPPPVNRAAKPGSLGTLRPPLIDGAKQTDQSPTELRTSPFTSPPTSESSSNGEEAPPVPVSSKPRPLPATDLFVKPDKHETKTSSMPNARPQRISSYNLLKTQQHGRRRSRSDNAVSKAEEEARPRLPPRQRVGISESMTSVRAGHSLDLPRRASATPQDGIAGSFPPRRESQTPIAKRSRMRDGVMQRRMSITPPPRPKPETSFNRTFMKSSPVLTETSNTPVATQTPAKVDPVTGGFPNSSRANRKPPIHGDGPPTINTGYDPRLIDACGEHVCTSGTSTQVWHIGTGKLVMAMAHPEGTKTTALTFKPSRNIDKEGQYIWLGTNFGEIMEIDVTKKCVTDIDGRTHSRREIVKMYRKAAEIWSIDNDGKLIVWPSDDSGTPNLTRSVLNGKVPRGVTSSVLVGNKLWIAAGKQISIFQPNVTPAQIAVEVTQDIISAPSGGDITSSAYLCSDPDRVYCGHSDGKISIFSRKTNKHIETVSVSLYKVSCLAGVGDYLWAGFNNGIIMLFDTKTRPWRTTKYWHGHSHPVIAIMADQSSTWKVGRYNVLSLGMDGAIGIWDGLLEDDWIQQDTQKREAEYCTYKDVTALVLTWNAGAAKPSDLRYDQKNSNFFRDLLSDQNHSPDIIVFGLQELVDLEDKKLTAKSFFKGKTKDSYGQEHLSRVYRDWRDYLTRCLDESSQREDAYVQLYSASLVGLFTCIFVKTPLRSRIRDLVGAEVKTGMGGLHGNKGSLIVRFILDDTAMCFANCHLAAGQTQTMHRNQDVQAILGTDSLPPGRSSDAFAGTFQHGGDGSMIMDHEICVLNGDLNYRIDTMSRNIVLQAIKTKNLQKLLDRDQLLLSRRKNPDFRLRDFSEAKITFLPTYKYDVGTDNYDSSDKQRAPAWCDRILSRGDDAIEQLEYRRHEIRVSDHRPVSATFKIHVKTRRAEACEKVILASQERFQKAKQTIADESKSAYLKSLFGVSEQEARQLLKSH